MRPLAALAILVLCPACAGDDGDTGQGDTSGAATTATASSGDDSGSEGGNMLTCDANVEFAFADGVELGAQSITTERLEIGGDVQYTVSVIGDAAGTTQLDIVFVGVPTAGTEYVPSEFQQVGQPRVELLPPLDGALDLQGGTVTYTTVGTAGGDVLALEVDLQFMRGTLAGCIHTDLTVQVG